MRKETFILVFLLIGLVIGIIDFKENYSHYCYANQENPILTRGVVTGYSTGGRWTKYYVKWFDFNGNEHFATNFNTASLPLIGDSIDIIYYLNDTNYGIINKDEDLMGGLKLKGIKLFIIIILNIGFLIYILKKRTPMSK